MDGDINITQGEEVLPEEMNGFKRSIEDLNIKGLTSLHIDMVNDEIWIKLSINNKVDKLVINYDFVSLNDKIIDIPKDVDVIEGKYRAFAELYRIRIMGAMTTYIYFVLFCLLL